MNSYLLLHSRSSGTVTANRVEAATLAQAERKLYRAARVNPKQAKGLGYKVIFEQPKASK